MGGSLVNKKYMETCFSNIVTGGFPALERYVEPRLERILEI